MSEKEKVPTMRELLDSMKVLDEVINRTNEYNKKCIEKYGLTQDFCEFIGDMPEEEIEQLTLTQINSYLAQYGVDSSNILQVFSKEDPMTSTLDKWKEFLAELRKATRDMNESLTVREELRQACDDVYAEQIKFINSEEYKHAYKEQIAKLQEMIELEPDPDLKKAYERKLGAVRKSGDLSFLLERLDDPKINKKNRNKELMRLVDIFFDKARGQYLMERYMTNAQKLGLNAQFHINLYDIEEKFLPEFYHPLNNFFLFVVMSYIAYINPADEVDCLYATSVLGMMGNLLTDSLLDSDKKILIGMIKNIEGRILEDNKLLEKFERDNTTWKEHPIRKELDEQRKEMQYRLELVDEIKGLLVGFAANLTDGTTLTAKNASTVLKAMSTEQIEGIRDAVKAEAERKANEEKAAEETATISDEADDTESVETE